MKLQTAKQIISCLPAGHRPFTYSKDDYALYLLSQATAGGLHRINELKKSSCASLLHKPRVKELLAKMGTTSLNPEHLLYGMGGLDTTKFNLTLGTWGGQKDDSPSWTQTTCGAANLVLQLNWQAKGARRFQETSRELVGHSYYGGYGHPISETELTLAWARIDCDLDSGEALIEEIQSDWIRGYIDTELRMNRKLNERYNSRNKEALKKFLRKESYIVEQLQQNKKLWAEATLLAAIRFIREELGISNIYYHSFDSGCALKRITYSKPPRSLYTDLPRKFCMKQSGGYPEFLEKSRYFKRQKRRINTPIQFFQLPKTTSHDPPRPTNEGRLRLSSPLRIGLCLRFFPKREGVAEWPANGFGIRGKLDRLGLRLLLQLHFINFSTIVRPFRPV